MPVLGVILDPSGGFSPEPYIVGSEEGDVLSYQNVIVGSHRNVAILRWWYGTDRPSDAASE